MASRTSCAGRTFSVPGMFLRDELALVVLLPLDLDGVDGFHVAVVVAVELLAVVR